MVIASKVDPDRASPGWSAVRDCSAPSNSERDAANHGPVPVTAPTIQGPGEPTARDPGVASVRTVTQEPLSPSPSLLNTDSAADLPDAATPVLGPDALA